MSEATWATWRAAEEQLAADGDVDTAASGLPERQTWILRALAALADGDRGALEVLAPSAPTEELRAVADLALSEPGDFDPTRFRASLKRMGVQNKPLPALDLLRLACQAHGRGEPTRPPSLAKAAHTRPVLNAALMVLSKRFKPYKVEDHLLARSPRMASFWAAGVAQQLTLGDVRDFVRDQVPAVEPLPSAPWPDLNDPIDTRKGSQRLTSLGDFLEDPLGAPWGPLCSREAAELAEGGDKEQRFETIGGLLDAIDLLVRDTLPEAAIPVTLAAANLVEACPDVQHREVLLNQIWLLHIRLCWSSPDKPTDLIEPVWSGLREHPPAARAQCARSILSDPTRIFVPGKIRAEVLAFAARSDADWDDEVVPWLHLHGRNLDMLAFQGALRDAPVELRERALGQVHAIHGSCVEACRWAARMFERGAGDQATLIALAALERCLSSPPRKRRDKRLQHRAVLELARAAAAAEQPPTAELVSALLCVGDAERDAAQQKELLSVVIPSAQMRLELGPVADRSDLLSRLHVRAILGDPKGARTEFREFGRWLRCAPREQTMPAALRMCAGLCPDEDTVYEYHDRDESSRSSGSEAPGDPRLGWLHSLTTWLDRQDPATSGRHAVTLAREEPALAPCLELWFQELSDLDLTDEWSELIRMCEEPELPPFLGGIFDDLREEFERFR